MPSFHKILIKLRNDLGYEHQANGVCVLYAEKAIDAFLIGEYSNVFKVRCNFIIEHHEALPALIKTEREKVRTKYRQLFSPRIDDVLRRQIIFDVAAFIEQGELYQRPTLYWDVFDKKLTQPNVRDVSRYAQSAVLEKLKGRALLASFIGAYGKEQLLTFINQLNLLANTSSQNFALSLSNGRHRLGLCYSHTDKNWLLIDANQYDIAPIPIDENCAFSLVDNILIAFEHMETGVCAFTTQLFTTGKQKKMMQKYVKTWCQTKELIDIHEVNPAHVMRRTAQGITLTWLAARAGNTNILKKIIKLGSMCDLNLANSEGVTPAFVAAQFNQANALKILVKAKVQVDLNKTNKEGSTPVYVAIENRSIDALRILVKMKKRIDPNQPTTEDLTPAILAARNNDVEALQVLAEAEAGVDFDYVSKQGYTAIHIAAYHGHLEAVTFLLKVKVNLSYLYKGKSALELAKAEGHHKVATAIKKATKPRARPYTPSIFSIDRAKRQPAEPAPKKSNSICCP